MSNPWDADPIVEHAAKMPWDADPVVHQSGVAADVAKSAGAGVVRGVTGTVGLIPAIEGLLHSGFSAGMDKLLGPRPEGVDAPGKAVGAALSPAGLTKGVEAVAGPLHQPETTAGKYAETIGEFAPSAVAGPGGWARKLAEVVFPAAASEAAGQATAGTAAEPWARLAAGLITGGGVTTAASHAGAPESMVARAVGNASEADFQTAQKLQQEAARLGVPLTGPEAVQAATNGATKLGDVMRVVEGSTVGGAKTGKFFADRPQQVQDASGRVFDQIAPASARPSTIGPQSSEAAQGAIDAVRHDINEQTAPLYLGASMDTVPPTTFATIAADPAFAASLARLRKDKVLGPQYASMPDNSIGVIDAVTKDMRAQGEALSSVANPGFQPQKSAMFGSGANDARALASDPARGGSQMYADALAVQAQRRAAELDPLQQGPLGRLAATTDTRTATNTLLPSQPLTGGEGEIADTVARLAAQNPDVPPALIRQHLADKMDAAAQDLQSGSNQYVGAKFNKAVAGSPQQRANLDAALGAANVQSDLPALLQVLQATGMRKPQGSATEFNRQMAADLGHVPLAVEAAKTVATGGLNIVPWLGKASDAMKRAYLGSNSGRLADLFTSPDSVSRIRQIAQQSAEHPLAALFARSLLQAPAEVRQR